jgi:hypothetical protein
MHVNLKVTDAVNYFELCGKVIDEKDIARLDELGWFESEDSWSCWT